VQYIPFSPVEIVFSSRIDAIKYLDGVVSANETCLLLASEGRILELGLESLIDNLREKDVVHLRQIPRNPDITDVYHYLKVLQGVNPCKIIAIGGGSCIDLAKAISALYYQIPSEQLSVELVRKVIKEKKYLSQHPFIDIIAVPTTAGTGSEVTKWATIWDMTSKEKFSIESVDIFPKVALIVPEFTSSMPERLTLSSGLDALSHAMEAFWANRRTPLSQLLALKAIEHIKNYLPQVLQKPSDVCLRREMSLASLLAGLAFSITRTTACHSISYPLTMYCGVDHGFAAAMTLIQVAELNEMVLDDMHRIYSIFGSKASLKQWLGEISLPIQELRLSAFGINKSELDIIARNAFTQGRMDNNPVPFSQKEVYDILLQVL
jgi:alcohol dehydrogenase class IV